MAGQSNMVNRFSMIPDANIPRSSFNRSCKHITTFDADYLIPIFFDEALPADTFNLNMSGFARLNTPLYPLMDNLIAETFFFEIPLRQLWNNFRKFMGEQVDPGDSIDYTIPQVVIPLAQNTVGSLWDYMGIPPVNNISISALFARAYQHTINEWFRDQNLIDSWTVDLDDGPDTASDYALRKACKKHDYFTSGLPWPNKSGTDVSLPLGTTANVISSAAEGAAVSVYSTAETDQRRLDAPATAVTISATTFGNNLQADLTNATAATINQLRESIQIQRLLERDARGGTRYHEILRAHFNVHNPMPAYRPIYLGGGKSGVQITPVPQTSESGTTPQGTLSSTGTLSFSGHGFTKSFTEHSVILGLLVVRADLTYSQGVNRMFSRSTRYDYYWPSLSHLGEQPTLNKEIWADGTANDDLTFNYQERFAEYRYKPSLVTGLMRPDAASTLAAWHLSEDFATLPAFNQTFIESTTPIDRVVAVPAQPDFVLDTFFNVKCARPMPMYSVPGMLDHF